jgi:phospholipid N-methyltransferase
MKLRDARVFYRAWIRSPLRVGAIAPSSCGLGDLITSKITVASAPILELGPGTGVFTRALLARGIPENRLTLVECDPGFAHILQVLFPAARVLSMDAARLGAAHLFDDERVGAVISGLPLISMTARKRMAILNAAFRQMRPGAGLYQFTYGLRCPVPRSVLDRLGLKAKRMGTVFGNIPPASVYRIRRRQPRQSCLVGSTEHHVNIGLKIEIVRS